MVTLLCGLALFALPPHLLSPDDLVLHGQSVDVSRPLTLQLREDNAAPQTSLRNSVNIAGLTTLIAGGSVATAAGAVFWFASYDSLFTDNDPRQRALDERRKNISRVVFISGGAVALAGLLVFLYSLPHEGRAQPS